MRNSLAPPYYSQRAVFSVYVSLSAFFSYYSILYYAIVTTVIIIIIVDVVFIANFTTLHS